MGRIMSQTFRRSSVVLFAISLGFGVFTGFSGLAGSGGGGSALARSSGAAYVNTRLAKDAARYEAYLKKNWTTKNSDASKLRISGERILRAGKDPRAASRWFAAAVVANGRDAKAWLGLARALLAIKPDRNNGSERYRLPVNGAASAYIAYQRASRKSLKAEALFVLAQGLKRRSYWRSAIDSLKASLQLVSSRKVQKAYELLRAEHGFRVIDYKTDSDAARPRLCVKFSENLARGDVDFAKFISINGKDPQAVSAEARQICVDGLKHGQRYEIQLRAGLPSAIGENLIKTSKFAVYVRDRSPAVRITGRSYVLPNKGQQGLPLVTVNTDKVSIEILKIGDRSLAATVQDGHFQKQLRSWQLDDIRNKSGVSIYKGEMSVVNKLNKDVATAFPVSQEIPSLKPGVYVMAAKPLAGKRRDIATQWFIVSDLGLSVLTSDNGIHAFVRSLASAAPRPGIDVRLIARNNEVLGSAKTDANGYAHFAAGLARGEGGLAPAILVAQSAGADYAFLDLATSGFNLTDRGVKGREPPGPLDAYLYSDRGVYRPGATVFLTGLVRDRAAHAAKLPVTLVIARPDGVEYKRYALTDEGLGGRSKSVKLGRSVMTGTWRARLYADPKADPIAQIKFLVEDFVPERMELKLAAKSQAITADKGSKIAVAGRYLYGPPAANLSLAGDIIVRASSKPIAGLEGYQFGLAGKTIAPTRASYTSLPRTDKDGKAMLDLKLPPLPQTARPLQAQIMIRLLEAGGRSIERSLVMPVDLRQPRIGIKPAFKDNHLGEDQVAAFDVKFLNGNGQAVAAKGLKWQLLRLNRQWLWYRQNGSWRYERVTYRRRIASGSLDINAGGIGKIRSKVGWGDYLLEVSRQADSAAAASASAAAHAPIVTTVAFSAGWWSDDGADSPEVLDVALDRKSYKPGDVARLRINAKTAGKAMIAVLNNGLVTSKMVDVPKGGSEVPITVDGNWAPGVYVTATLYRPMDSKAKRMPGRSIGLRWLALDSAARTLQVKLDLPKKVKSGGRLRVPVKLAGLKPGERAYVTVAAVDVGVLSLTRFKSPAPQKWFYAQRRLGTEIRDFYGRLIDGMRAERGRMHVGGDGPGGMSIQGAPPAEKPLALFSGILQVDAKGSARADFDLPDFNGAVRVMAVAWSEDKVGSGTANVIIRDPIALLASAPRFLTMGDETRLTVDMHNVEGPAASYTLSVERENEAGLKTSLASREITLKQDERRFERIAIKADEIGLATYSLQVTGPNGIDVRRSIELDVKPPANDIRRTMLTSLKPGASLKLTSDLFASLIKSRSRLTVNVGPSARLDVPGILNALDRYPYGCAEQTVSRALPLLYSNALAVQVGIATDVALKSRVQAAIEHVFEMQDSSGAFGVWGPSSTDMWLTGYVSDFLTRAVEAGYKVRPAPMRQALDRLQNFVSYAQDFDKGGESLAYALYVLARNGRAPIGELRYYVDTRLNRFASPLAKAQLGAALAMMGDQPRAETAFAAAMADLGKPDDGRSRADYGSTLRDGAALLTLVSETPLARSAAGKSKTARLLDVVAKAYAAKRYTSTQEQAWTVLAARALSQKAKRARLKIDGKAHAGALMRSFKAGKNGKAGALAGNGVTISNEGAEPIDAVITVMGASATPEPAASHGLRLERSYYTLDGKQVDLASATGGTAQLRQNDRLVVVLKIDAVEGGGRLLLADRLPAGLEIENPHLVDGGNLKALAWLKTTLRPRTTQFRDDRFVAAFNFFGRGRSQGSKSATVAYIVRAVTPGSFVHPAATVEDMYRPQRFARTASGRLIITAR